MRAYAREATPQALIARDELIVAHIDMARRIAGRVARRLPKNLGIDEIIGAAMLGLAEAADRFDPSLNETFEAFATPRIRGAVIDELRRGDPLPRRKRTMARKLQQTIARLEQKLGHPASDEEIAAELNIPVEEYRDELEGLTHVGLVELDEGAVGAGTSMVTEGRMHLSSPFAMAERSDVKERLVAALKKLSEREALVMSLYYDEQLTFAEIARIIGVTESRICQIHSQAVLRLRARMEKEEEE